MTNRTSTIRSLGLLVALSVPAGSAFGQAPPQDSTFSPQLFHPAVGPDEYFGVQSAVVPAHLNYSLGFWLNYSRDSFLISNVKSGAVSDDRARVLGDTVGADLVFSMGLWNRVQLGIGLPVTAYQGGDANVTLPYNGVPFTLKVPQAFTLGDPWLDVKVRLWGATRGVNLAVQGFITAPLNQLTPKNSVDSTGNFGGESSVSGGLNVLAGWESERWRAGIAVGFLGRAHTSTFFSSTVGNQLTYGAAFAYDVLAQRKLSAIGELRGHADLSNKHPYDGDTCKDLGGCGTAIDVINGVPLELDVGVKLRVARSVFTTIGIGTGVIRGMGSPLVRVFAGVTWAPDRRDRDKDGVPDTEDQCPDEPEDRDGFKDDDGCPDPDNDGDGIPDVRDKCPNDAEDFDGFEDDDGCPDPDNDKDGIPDLKDACPLDPEDHKAPRPDDGCPLSKTDSDGDGVFDNNDKCPVDPEDMDGFQDEDGCPDIDNDDDGIPDQLDKCPNEPEDKDGFEDDDGCLELDNDNDGIPDKEDKCPNEPETINGFQDEDGCPDKGPALKVQIIGDEIIIMEKVFFKTGKAIIEPKSFNLLDQVASILRIHREIKKVLIEGHTDSKGVRIKNIKLSQDRADSVKAFIVKNRVEASRLIAKGFGPDRPVAENKTERGREANRRVQFKILESEKKIQPAAAPEPAAAPAPAPSE